jgi:hypothetical protein
MKIIYFLNFMVFLFSLQGVIGLPKNNARSNVEETIYQGKENDFTGKKLPISIFEDEQEMSSVKTQIFDSYSSTEPSLEQSLHDLLNSSFFLKNIPETEYTIDSEF